MKCNIMKIYIYFVKYLNNCAASDCQRGISSIELIMKSMCVFL